LATVGNDPKRRAHDGRRERDGRELPLPFEEAFEICHDRQQRNDAADQSLPAVELFDPAVDPTVDSLPFDLVVFLAGGRRLFLRAHRRCP
jgi:hypothetical protein